MAIKRKKSTFAIVAAAPAIPVKPSTPATSAMIPNIRAHFNINSIYACAVGRQWVQGFNSAYESVCPDVRSCAHLSVGDGTRPARKFR